MTVTRYMPGMRGFIMVIKMIKGCFLWYYILLIYLQSHTLKDTNTLIVSMSFLILIKPLIKSFMLCLQVLLLRHITWLNKLSVCLITILPLHSFQHTSLLLCLGPSCVISCCSSFVTWMWHIAVQMVHSSLENFIISFNIQTWKGI